MPSPFSVAGLSRQPSKRQSPGVLLTSGKKRTLAQSVVQVLYCAIIFIGKAMCLLGQFTAFILSVLWVQIHVVPFCWKSYTAGTAGFRHVKDP